ncbi:MAG: glycogen synthase [Thermoplasmata archaeon]
MKVCLMTYEFPPRIYGGAGVHALHMVNQLRDLVELEVRTLHPAEDVDGVKVRRYYPSLPKGPEDPAGKALEVLSLNANMLSDPVDADVVHTHTWYTSFAGLLAKKMYSSRLVATVHSLEPLRPWKEEQLGRGYRLSSWLEDVELRACDAVIAVSKDMATDLRKHYDIPAERIHIIHNGVDASAFCRKEDPALLDRLGVRAPYILFLGRLSRQKGIFDLLEAFKRLRSEVSLVLVTGPTETEKLVKDLSDAIKGTERVLWINRIVTHEEAVALYSSCEAFVCSSRYEPFGITNLEAMACERPVVATSVGGVVEVVVHGETGLLVPPEDPEQLAAGIDAVLSDRTGADEMGRNGRKRVEEFFTWEKVAEMTCRLYETLLA